MAKKYCAQSLSEVAIFSGVVFGICAISVFAFGDQLGNILNNNPIIATFTKDRTESVAEKNALLSNVKINANGSSFSAPLEDVIRTRLANGTLQTSGSSGNIDETVDVIQGYINQLTSLLNSLPSSSEKIAVQNAITAYTNSINNYKNMNGVDANNPNRELVKQLNITTDLEVSGTNAMQFQAAMDELIKQVPSNQEKELLTIYQNGMLNLGGSLDYKIDSRIKTELGLDTPINNINTKIADLDTLLADPDIQAILGNLSGDIKNFDDIDKLAQLQAKIDDLSTSSSSTQSNSDISIVPWQNNNEIQVKASDSTSNGYSLVTKSTDSSYQQFYVGSKPVGYPLNQVTADASIIGTYSTYLNTQGITNINDYKIFGPEWVGGNKIYYLVKKDSFNKIKEAKVTGTKPSIKVHSFKCDWTCSTSSLSNITPSTTSVTDSKIAELKNKIAEIYAAKDQITTQIKAALSSGKNYSDLIKVYRNGSYKSILPDSFNSEAVCKSLQITPVNGSCSISQ